MPRRALLTSARVAEVRRGRVTRGGPAELLRPRADGVRRSVAERGFRGRRRKDARGLG